MLVASIVSLGFSDVLFFEAGTFPAAGTLAIARAVVFAYDMGLARPGAG
ncbi:hypothetical protein ACGFJ7_29260 [Actinoplanes sp. NPDC048988]